MLHKAFANGSSATFKFSKLQLSKMVKLGFIIDEMLGQLSLFKYVKSIEISVKLHAEQLNKKDLPTSTKEMKNVCCS